MKLTAPQLVLLLESRSLDINKYSGVLANVVNQNIKDAPPNVQSWKIDKSKIGTITSTLYELFTQLIPDTKATKGAYDIGWINQSGISNEWQKFLQKFRSKISKYDANFSYQDDGAWFHMVSRIPRPDKQSVGKSGKVDAGWGDSFPKADVTYKEYFTFTPVGDTPENKLKSCRKFMIGIFRLMPRIIELSENNQDSINIKFPPHISELAKHADSMCIHYYNKSSGKAIRQLVDQAMQEVSSDAEVELSRPKGRVASGYDFKFNKRNPDDEEETHDVRSHSQLLARAVAENFAENWFGKRFDPVTVDQVKPWLKAKILAVNKWGPEKMWQALKSRGMHGL